MVKCVPHLICTLCHVIAAKKDSKLLSKAKQFSNLAKNLSGALIFLQSLSNQTSVSSSALCFEKGPVETKEIQYILFNAEFSSVSAVQLVGIICGWCNGEQLNVRILWHAFFEQCTSIRQLYNESSIGWQNKHADTLILKSIWLTISHVKG